MCFSFERQVWGAEAMRAGMSDPHGPGTADLVTQARARAIRLAQALQPGGQAEIVDPERVGVPGRGVLAASVRLASGPLELRLSGVEEDGAAELEERLQDIADFLAGKPMPARCYAPYFSVFVDCFGDVLPCGGHFYAGKAACNLDGRTLGELWRDPAYQATRDKLRRCRCCYYSCMAELNLTYAKFP